MQSLAKRHLANFEQLIRQKGRQLFQAGRCQISRSEPGLIRGLCRDAEEKLNLGVRLQGSEIHVHCECSYFQAGTGFCRHLWALFLTIDQRGVSHYIDPDEGVDSALIADEIWLDRPVEEKLDSEERKSWKSLIGTVERIRQTQEKLLFKPVVQYNLDFSHVESQRHVMTLTIFISAQELSAEEGNPFLSVPMERLLSVLRPSDAEVFALVLSNCASDPMGAERIFRLPLNVEPKLSSLLVGVGANLSFGGVPRGRLKVDSTQPWEIILRIEDQGSYSLLRPLLSRGSEEVALDKIEHFVIAYPRGFYVDSTRCILKDNVDNVWLQALENGEAAYMIPVSGIRDFLTHFSKACSGLHPRVEWPENFWTVVEIDKQPLPILQVEFNELGISGDLLFEYAMDPPQRLSAYSAQNQVLQWNTRRSCTRDFDFEKQVMGSMERIPNLGYMDEDHLYHIDHEYVHEVLRGLQAAGILLFGKERRVKTYSKVQLEISTNIDWFEVKGKIDFDGQSVAIGDMLDAIRNNSRFVLLGNGEFGLMPDQWIAKNRHLLEMAENKNGAMNIKKNQFLLLQQMVSDNKSGEIEVKKSKGARELNEMVQMAEHFNGLKEAEQPKPLNGQMRPYQLSGLAWLEFLKKFQFGGILADDMGLGKTIQAIASLINEYILKNNKGELTSALIILPTSLVFNWMDELQKFCPQLKVYAYTGSERGSLDKVVKSCNVMLTTYGILRRQAEEFSRIEWYYIILDEAQAIKNHKSQIATAVCSLRGTHRLSLTGTPIENNLLELWSHMQFLNPSLLGSRDQFASHMLKPETNKDGTQGLQRLQKIVFPFILRRTKEDVLSDLPAKVEQVVYCTMGSRQQEYYNTVRDEFRRSLLDNMNSKGVGGSKLKVIEGLLRLRQVACHPSLVDRNLSIPSTKLKHLISSLQEAISEGHKALVFSQFTSMLELIVRELSSESVRFTYLDGQTKDRQERVKAFQEDQRLQVFLISLKAGGTGLNLTAADYVFLYDPWWNPAAEQQAIDRAHRIGQTKKVFTYRLITKDTVEEKVVELQQQKRDMVKGIIGDDGEFVKKLNKQDIEYLFT